MIFLVDLGGILPMACCNMDISNMELFYEI
nr:MAG TPA: hypothetical protein [Bacteriophage sp.]